MSEFEKLKNYNNVITDKFPKLNNQYLIESSIDLTYKDIYYPINEFKKDSYIEFRVPKTTAVYTDFSGIYLKFHLKVFKQKSETGRWSENKKLETGDWLDLVQNSAYSIIKLLTLDVNNVQIQNIDNYALNAYIKVITNFPSDQYSKLAKLIHLEEYGKIQETYKTDAYFTDLKAENPISKRLINLREKGVFIYAPVLLDISKIKSFLIDGVDFIFRFTLHDEAFIFNTHQYNPLITGVDGKRYKFELDNVSLHVTRYKPSKNAYAALESSLAPKNNFLPTIDYPFMSQISKQYYLPEGIDSFNIELPFDDRVPEKVYLAMQTTDAFNTREHEINGLYLTHLNIKNIYITLNSSTIYNINCDFENGNVSEIYHTLLNAIGDDNHLITYENFQNGCTLFGFNLVYKDQNANIISPMHGMLRIVLTFKDPIFSPSMVYLLGDILSLLSINYNREIFLNKS